MVDQAIEALLLAGIFLGGALCLASIIANLMAIAQMDRWKRDRR